MRRLVEQKLAVLRLSRRNGELERHFQNSELERHFQVVVKITTIKSGSLDRFRPCKIANANFEMFGVQAFHFDI
jgi:hypothetical protein